MKKTNLRTDACHAINSEWPSVRIRRHSTSRATVLILHTFAEMITICSSISWTAKKLPASKMQMADLFRALEKGRQSCSRSLTRWFSRRNLRLLNLECVMTPGNSYGLNSKPLKQVRMSGSSLKNRRRTSPMKLMQPRKQKHSSWVRMIKPTHAESTTRAIVPNMYITNCRMVLLAK